MVDYPRFHECVIVFVTCRARLPVPDDLTPMVRFYSPDFIPAYDKPHDDRDAVRVRVWNEGILPQSCWVCLGSHHSLCRSEISVLQTTSRVVCHE